MQPGGQKVTGARIWNKGSKKAALEDDTTPKEDAASSAEQPLAAAAGIEESETGESFAAPSLKSGFRSQKDQNERAVAERGGAAAKGGGEFARVPYCELATSTVDSSIRRLTQSFEARLMTANVWHLGCIAIQACVCMHDITLLDSELH
jgi:hypothetical protein